jgi:integrase
MPNFSKVIDRQKLKPRRDPYWIKISSGCYLGFRKMKSNSSGSWTARFFDSNTQKQAYKALGDLSEHQDHLRYDIALKEAQKWFTHLGKGGSSTETTINDACHRYLDHLKTNKGDKSYREALNRFNRYIFNSKNLCSLELSKLTPLIVENWRKTVAETPNLSGQNKGEKRSPSSINRDITSFRAALNMAFKDGLVTSDFSWRSKLNPIKNADKKRDFYLDSTQRKLLAEKAPEDLRNLILGLSFIPLRPGALADLKVSNFNKKINILTIGKDKSGQDRKIALPDSTAIFFGKLCENKLPQAHIFLKSDGFCWNKDSWKYPVKKSAKLAELPNEITLYSIRHSVITDLIHKGLDILTVAQISGTSVRMIEKHYGHLTVEHAKKALAQLNY